MSDINLDLLLRDECQPLTTAQMNGIKSQFHPSNTANVNIVPYHIYSPNEHPVGEWQEMVDGVLKKKPVYERTINFGALPNNSTKSVAHGIDNVDFVLSVNMISSNNNYFLPIPYVATDNISNGRELWLDKTNISVRITKDSSSYVKTYVTVTYTKTTDQWQPV